MRTQAEIQELDVKIRNGAPPDKLNAVARIATLCSQGVETEPVFEICLMSADPNQSTYIRYRRFLNVLMEAHFQLSIETPSSNNAINLILSDFERPDPVLRALSIREIGKIFSEKYEDRLIQPVIRAIKDSDPFVRKSAALAILSLYKTKSSYLDKYQFQNLLKELVEDSNPNVCANAVSAVLEINSSRTKPIFEVLSSTVNNLLASFDQTNEWSQIQILDYVCSYRPKDPNDARGITARVVSRLSHNSPAVVLSAVRCCLQMNLFIDDQSKIRDTLSKIVQPLVSLLNHSIPIQYVSLKSILILLQHYRKMLSNEVSIFFCKYDDPIFY